MKPATLAGRPLHDIFHVCAFFRSREEEYRVLAPFLAEGLEGGEKAVYIVDPDRRAEHKKKLAASIGGDFEKFGPRLDVITWRETYLQDGVFDPDRMIDTVEATFAAAVAEGYPRMRICGEMEWVHSGAPGVELLLEYETRCNDVIARAKQPAVCCYQVDRLSASLMMDILRTHPLAIIGGTLYENPFFTPPQQMLAELRQRKAAA